MSRPLLLDLFCGAGGAAMGYHRAGFDVLGVDKEPQPRYPFRFIQADAIEYLASYTMVGVAAIHASPPCQSYSGMTNCRPGVGETYPQLIDVTRELLSAQRAPWVIENVDGSGLASQDDLFGANGLLLCSTMFGLKTYRHRLFEASFPLPALSHPRHDVPASKAGHWKPGTFISVAGNCAPIALARKAMDIDWTNRDELAEAIPPPFTEYIGRALLAELEAAA